MKLYKFFVAAACCSVLAGCGLFDKEKLVLDGERIPVLSTREAFLRFLTSRIVL